jgi:7tm Odorant receptor
MESSKFLEALKVPMRILKIAGFWDCESVKRKHKVQQFFAHLIFCEIFILLQIIYLFTAKNLVDITKLLSVLRTSFGFSIKSIHMLKERKAIVALIEEAKELATLVQTDDEKSLQALNRRTRQIKTKFWIFLSSGLITIVIALIITIIINVVGSNSPYEPPFKIWMPSDCENNVYCFSFVTFYEIICAGIAASTVIPLDALPIFFFNIGSGLLEELGEILSKVCDEGKEDKMAMKEFEKYSHKNQKIRPER